MKRKPSTQRGQGGFGTHARWLGAAAALLFVASIVSMSGSDVSAAPAGKITICHVPPGAQWKAVTITVSQKAWKDPSAHKGADAHGPGMHGGDYEGSCVKCTGGVRVPANGPCYPPQTKINFRKTSQTSGPAKLKQATTYMGKMNSSLNKVKTLAGRARKEKDIIKLNCVNDKLIVMKGSIRVAEISFTNLKNLIATARGNTPAASHEFSKITITFQKVTVLAQEAEACIGDELAYVGRTQVKVDIDPSIPQHDPTKLKPVPFDPIRPPIASPTQ